MHSQVLTTGLQGAGFYRSLLRGFNNPNDPDLRDPPRLNSFSRWDEKGNLYWADIPRVYMPPRSYEGDSQWTMKKVLFEPRGIGGQCALVYNVDNEFRHRFRPVQQADRQRNARVPCGGETVWYDMLCCRFEKQTRSGEEQ